MKKLKLKRLNTLNLEKVIGKDSEAIKSLYKTPQPHDSYHQLTRAEQVTIFRLRTGHNRLNKHLHRKLHVVPSPICPCACGEVEQDTVHVLQERRLLYAVPEGGDLANAPPRQAVRASGCSADDHHIHFKSESPGITANDKKKKIRD